MIDSAIKEQIQSVIKDQISEGTLLVLKGISMAYMDLPKIDLAHTIANKIGRLMEISGMNVPATSFGEFVCLYQMLLMQFKKIVILENPLYWNYYPVDESIPEHISQQLLRHFDEDSSEEEILGDIEDYIQVYSNYFQIDSANVCCYNLETWELDQPKISQISLPTPRVPLPLDLPQNSYSRRDLGDEKDYFSLILALQHTGGIFSLAWSSFDGDIESLTKRLDMLSAFYPGRLFAQQREMAQSVPSNPELSALLRRFYPDASFRDIRTYDVQALDDGIKKITQVSQEAIIQDVISQAERAMNGQSFRDVFVTAPTGSGKSLMFQIPAIYLAEKYDLVTLVITPLIGLMNDQVEQLSRLGYTGARTINSDISPLVKQEILDEIAEGKCHILYLSPESLLGRSDVEQLIGPQQIGLLVVDEAHIVTTWGKQFRPDYWYLGDHVQRLRRAQTRSEKHAAPFVLATFTATAIYHGVEDMYQETLNSLHMIDPITYLGYLKRDNISIEISEVPEKKGSAEYELNKFDDLINLMDTALMRGQKVLIYFPTVTLIRRFWSFCGVKNMGMHVVRYHGQLTADEKNEGFKQFRSGQRPIMLATKAFGMGIDVPDISVVIHFAPTGNVCDYMQEIGRAARSSSIEGHAIYHHMRNDFKHINRLHGMSTIRLYQLVEVQKKILELYQQQRRNEGAPHRKKNNAMLIDVANFAYLFDNLAVGDSDNLINIVKTAMLLIQKDYSNRGYAPFGVRPVPLFAYGFFAMSDNTGERLNQQFRNCAELVDRPSSVYKVNLRQIWERSCKAEMSFPKFKYMLYTKSDKLSFNSQYSLSPALSIELFLEKDWDEIYRKSLNALKAMVGVSITQSSYLSPEQMVEIVSTEAKISRYKAENIINVTLAAMNSYRKNFSANLNTDLYRVGKKEGSPTYFFNSAANSFFRWLERTKRTITTEASNNKLYIVNTGHRDKGQEITTVLGVLESFGSLRFKSLGGSDGQLYIYVFETKSMLMVREKPQAYRNRLLEMVNERHYLSVKMLSFLYQNGFSSDEVWEYLENYFLGILPPELSAPQ